MGGGAVPLRPHHELGVDHDPGEDPEPTGVLRRTGSRPGSDPLDPPRGRRQPWSSPLHAHLITADRPIRLFLLRHGRSLANEQGLIASHLANAGDAYGLLPVGRDQIRHSIETAQAAGLLELPVRLTTSPLLRARESIAVAADILGVTPTVDPRLIERDFGELELQPDDQYEQVWAADRLDPTHRSWGVESVADVLCRAGPLLTECLTLDDARTVILCTHGDVASTLLCASLGRPLGQHREVGGLDTGELRELSWPAG